MDNNKKLYQQTEDVGINKCHQIIYIHHTYIIVHYGRRSSAVTVHYCTVTDVWGRTHVSAAVNALHYCRGSQICARSSVCCFLLTIYIGVFLTILASHELRFVAPKLIAVLFSKNKKLKMVLWSFSKLPKNTYTSSGYFCKALVTELYFRLKYKFVKA